MVVRERRLTINRIMALRRRYDASDAILFQTEFTHPYDLFQGSHAKDKNERMLEHFDKIFEDVASCGSSSENCF